MTQKVKTIIADGQRLFRQGFINLVSNSSVVEIIGEAENGKDLVEKYFQMKPDLIIVDISIPVLSGYQAFELIKARDNTVKVLFLTMYSEEIHYYKVYKYGGNGLLTKDTFIAELETAVLWIMKGKMYYGPDYSIEKLNSLLIKYQQHNEIKNNNGAHLTQREEEIIRLVLQGKTSSEIGESLNLSKRTIDKQRQCIMKKANARNLIDLYQFAKEYF